MQITTGNLEVRRLLKLNEFTPLSKRFKYNMYNRLLWNPMNLVINMLLKITFSHQEYEKLEQRQ